MMRTLITCAVIFLALIPLLLANPKVGSSNTEEKEQKQKKKEVKTGPWEQTKDFPFAVSVRVNNDQVCSGILLKPRQVVTIAECVFDMKGPTTQVTVRVGLSKDAQVIKVEEVYIHKDYESPQLTPFANIASLRLAKSVTERPTARPVLTNGEINNDASPPKPHSDAFTAGWEVAESDVNLDIPVDMWTLKSKVTVPRLCLLHVGMRWDQEKKSQFCLDYNHIGGTNHCAHDMGAPVVIDGVVKGMLGWFHQLECGRAVMPVLMLAPSMDWIEEVGKIKGSSKD